MLRTVQWLLMPLVILALAACGGGDDDDNRNRITAETPVVRIMPVSPHAPLLSIYFDDDDSFGDDSVEVGASPSHGQAVGFNLEAGERHLWIHYALPQEDAVEPETVLAFDSIAKNFEEGVRYEIFVGGDYPNGNYWIAETPKAFDEEASRARLAFAHAAGSDLGSVDIHIVEGDMALGSSTVAATIDSQTLDHSTRLAPGSYRLKVTPVGSTEVLFSSPPIAFEAGDDTTFALIDNAWRKPGDATGSALVLAQSGSGGSELIFAENSGVMIRATHASHDAGPLDILVGGESPLTIADGLELGEVSPYTAAGSGIHGVTVYPASGSSALVDQEHNFFNGVHWNLVIARSVEDIAPLFVPENARSVDAYARFRVINAAEEAGTIVAYLAAPGANLAEMESEEEGSTEDIPHTAAVRFGSASSFMGAAPATYDLVIFRTVTVGGVENVPLYHPRIADVTFEAGEVRALLLYDKADGTIGHTWLNAASASADEE